MTHGRPVRRQVSYSDQSDPDGQKGAVEIGELKRPQTGYTKTDYIFTGVTGMVKRREKTNGEINNSFYMVLASVGYVYSGKEHQVAEDQQKKFDHEHVVGGRVAVVAAIPT